MVEIERREVESLVERGRMKFKKGGDFEASAGLMFSSAEGMAGKSGMNNLIRGWIPSTLPEPGVRSRQAGKLGI